MVGGHGLERRYEAGHTYIGLFTYNVKPVGGLAESETV